MSTTLLALTSLLACTDLTPETVAPPTDDVRWARPDEGGELQRIERSGDEARDARPDGFGLEAWSGHPVLLLLLPEEGSREALELGLLAQRANVDRGLVVATVLRTRRPEESEESEAEPPELADDPDVAPSDELVAGFVGPESVWTPGPVPRAVVVGPTGEVVGTAELPSDEKDLLELLHEALNRYPAPPLGADLGEPLRDAQAEYFTGEWAAARKTAAKLAARLERKDADAAAAAGRLVEAVDEHERGLRAAVLRASGSMSGSEELARLAAVIERGFPRTQVAEDVEAAVAAQRKQMGTSTSYRVSAEWVEALAERPVLFPEVADSHGRRFAKRIEAITKTANYTSNLTRHIQALLLRYELADRR